MAAAEQQRTAAQRTAALEHLVNEQLKSDLQQVLERRDALYERIAHCLELRNNMTMLLDEQLHSLKTKVNLGCDFYVDASMCACPTHNFRHPLPPPPPPPACLPLPPSVSTGFCRPTRRHRHRSLCCRPDTSWVYVSVGLGFHAQACDTSRP